MTGVTVVGVRGHLVAVEAHVGSAPIYEIDAEPDPVGLLEVGEREDVEQLGAGSGVEGVYKELADPRVRLDPTTRPPSATRASASTVTRAILRSSVPS